MFFLIKFLWLFALVNNSLPLPYYQTFKNDDGDLRFRNVAVHVRELEGGHQYVWKIGGRVQYYNNAQDRGWGYICTGAASGWNEGIAFTICHQLNMKYFASLTGGEYGDIEAGSTYSVSTITCPSETGPNRGPNSLRECTVTASGACTNAETPPAAVECTLPFAESMACYNGGSPTASELGSGETSDSFELFIFCLCPPDFTGNMCEVDLKPVCQNGGTATQSGSEWTCSCTSQFSGTYCETDLKPVCQNGGTATLSDSTWICSCTNQFSGTYCETDLKPLCHNGGSPVVSGSTWSCSCTPQFSGPYCETGLKPVCYNGGTAVLSGDTWSCTCTKEFTGAFCEHDIKPLCLNGGTAEYSAGTWKCACLQKFTGASCESAKQASSIVTNDDGTVVLLQCLNGGVVNTETNTCTCGESFTGSYCETALNQAAQSEGSIELSLQNEFFLWILTLSAVLLIALIILGYMCVRRNRTVRARTRSENVQGRRDQASDAGSSQADEEDDDNKSVDAMYYEILDNVPIDASERRLSMVKPAAYTEVITTNKAHDLRMDWIRSTLHSSDSDISYIEADEALF